ncbi:hypothetical protein GWK47_015274 [Chionoecetes opilio]|uniref:Uncharacterized protein n=1 Tax=Chionoecetes opilio TaxID=41210 RepID=A0A8J4XVA0_CHIOP|nr:hypothetical protein GWK47_015274 [Chionoecetes opilio]
MTIDHGVVEDSNVRTRGRAEVDSKTSLRIHLVGDMMAGSPTKARLRPSCCSIRNASTWHHAVFEAVGVETEGDDLVPTPASPTSFKTTAATFLPVEPSLPGPQEGIGVSFPCEADGDASSVSPRGREEISVPMQDQPLRYLLVPSSTIFLGRLASLPAIRDRLDRCSSRPPYSPKSIQETER